MQAVHHRIHAILGLVALREDALPALHLHRHAVVREELHDVLIVKGAHTAVEEAAVALNVTDDLRHIRRIGDVAASLARDAHLAAGQFHLFQQRNPGAVLRRLDGGHHATGACSHDQNLLHSLSPCLTMPAS